MNRIFFLALIIFFSMSLPPLHAQTRLYGTVTSASGVAVEYATVAVVNARTPYGVTTDAKGRYQLTLRSTDSITLRVTCTGYETYEQRLLLTTGEQRPFDIVLKTSTTQLQEVVVSDDYVRNTTFTQIDIQRIESTTGPNEGVEALIKTLPDVSSNNELSSQYSVRGGSFDENLVYLNGVEIYRPQLIRSGQQEGLSIINPDLVSHLLFSPGGFDASCGDRMSSVLDITYNCPIERKHKLSLSLLGGSASAQGRIGERFSYGIGFRLHNNRYLFRSLDTEGNYTSSYMDLQGLFGYKVNDQIDLSLLTVWTRNSYGLIPSSRTTTFGSFMQSLEMNVYFDGQEQDKYSTLLGAFTLHYHPSDDFEFRWITSAQYNKEQELYDIQNQYWLYEVGLGENSTDTNRFDRGVGTFLEHARNYIEMGIYSTGVKAIWQRDIGHWEFGLHGQLEQINDRMREWKWVDSAGYSFPTTHLTPGVDDTIPYNPLLQLYCNADNQVQNLRATAYAQREVNLTTRHDHLIQLVAGVRGQFYTRSYGDSSYSPYQQFLCSPRLSVNYKPQWQQDMLFRIAAGIYQQPALYRELRNTDGTLRADLPAQCSYQATGTLDWNLRLWNMPFHLTTDIYYKYITHLTPYTIDNLRIRYNPSQEAVGYATGISLRINGDLVKGLESWASLSLMQTQEDILGDNLGWIARPTDQRFSIKLFLQDYIPTIPWWRMSLQFLYGTGTPVTFPYQQDRSTDYRLPSYFRVDWGNTIQLTRFERIKHSRVGRIFDEIAIGIDVFNLFNYRNVVSYIWVADYENTYYPVPNYLTARQVNVKLSLTF